MLNINSLTCFGIFINGKGVQFRYSIWRLNFIEIEWSSVSIRNRMVKLEFKFGYENVFIVDSVGSKGGLALFQKDGSGISIQSYSLHHINAEVVVSDFDSN